MKTTITQNQIFRTFSRLQRTCFSAVFLLLFLLSASSSWGQSCAYVFSSATTPAWAANTSSPTDITPSNTDDGLSSSIPIGFTFNYDGTNYTSFIASTNGWMSFNTGITDSYVTNSLSSPSARPIIAPLWDDLKVLGNINYKLTGSSPNRVMTVEWSQMAWNYNASTWGISFQVKLYETSNEIRFVYIRNGNAGANLSSASASIGLTGLTTGYISIDGTPAASTTSETSNISSKPANSQNFIFKPSIISTSSTLTAFSACSGSASSAQSFTVSGINMANNLVVTAPAGFEVSTSQTGTFSSSVSYTPSSGAISAQTVWIRMTNSASGSPSGNITCVSSPAVSKNIAVTATVNPLPATPTAAVNGSICISGTVTISATPATGSTIDWYAASTGGSVLTNGSGVNSFTTPSISSTTSYFAQNRNLTTGCLSAARLTVTASVNSSSVAGTVSANQTICSGTQPANITLTGSTGTIQWQVSTDNSTFNNISGATASPLTAAQMGTLTATRYYRAVVTSGVCSSINSSTVIITVAPNVTPTFTQVAAICSGASLSALPTTSLNSYTGTWSPAINNTATTSYTFTPTAGQCATTATMSITVNNNCIPAPVNGVITVSTPNTYTHTFPTFVKRFKAELIGAGGGGGRGHSNDNNRGAGGGGGAFAGAYLENSQSAYSIVVGASGQAGTNSSGIDYGRAGGNSKISTGVIDLLTANGGKGGVNNVNLSLSTTYNSAGGTATSDASVSNPVTNTGGNGGTIAASGIGNGGGGAASWSSNGNSAIGATGGVALGGLSGAGANGGSGLTGTTGYNYGGGGSGGGRLTSSRDGGAGANGVARFTYVDISNLSIASNVTVCNNTAATVTLNSTSLPASNYTVSYTTTINSSTSATQTAAMTFSGTSGTITVPTTVLTAAGSYTVSITRITLTSETGIYSEPTTALTGTINVIALPSMPSALSTNCSGSAVLTATAGSGETAAWYTSNSQSAALATNQIYSSNTATLTIASPTAATYYAFATNANGCKSANGTQTPVVVTAVNNFIGGTPGKPTDWFTAANWSCGAVPDETTNVVIPTGKVVEIFYTPLTQGAPTLPAKANSITLEAGNTTSLTIKTDHSLIVTDNITVLGTNSTQANFVVESDAALKQISPTAFNTGNIQVKRATRALKKFDGVLWSSPVEGQVVNNLSANMVSNYIKYYDVAANAWRVLTSASTSTFPKGTAYLLRTPSVGFDLTTPTPWNVTFTGKANNGNIEVTGPSITTPSSEQYYLVGNPYPSPINLNQFMASNPNVTGVFYFFRKTDNAPYSAYGVLTKTETSPGSGSYTSSYNVNHPTEGAIDPADVIPVGQGFFVTMRTNVEGKVYFNNDMRLVTNHGTFNRLQTNTEDKFKLNLTTTSNAANFSQMNLGYAEGSSSSYDVGYDAESFNDGRTNLSSMIASTPYSIQSRGTYAVTDFVPLYFKTNVNGEHRIKLQDAQGVFAADQMVILKDNLTGTQHNLTANGDYVFTSATGTFTNRFEVIYQQAYYTALQPVSCGTTLSTMSSLVYADLVNGATGYRFKVVNNTTSAVQTIDRPLHWFALNMLPSYDYNTAYTISVQVQKDGVWTGYYGTSCTVNSPNIASTGVMQINPSQCGVTLPTLGTVIATTPVANATGYKFRITNTTAGASGDNLVQEITRTNHWFTLGMLSRYNYGSSYAIEVAVKTTGGYTLYGNACTVYSPAVPTLASCGQAVATSTTLVRTTAMTLATQYRFQVTRMATQETITFDTANYWFSFRVNVPGYAAGEQYGVRVAVMTAGAWSPYGDACDLTAPIATARTTEEAAPSEAGLFKPVAYPNPFTTSFGISLATPSADVVHVIVYDLQGRLIEKQNVFVSELDGLQIGTNYPSGDYLMVVAQGANIKSSHIHKD